MRRERGSRCAALIPISYRTSPAIGGQVIASVTGWAQDEHLALTGSFHMGARTFPTGWFTTRDRAYQWLAE